MSSNTTLTELNNVIKIADEEQSEELFLSQMNLSELPQAVARLQNLKSVYLFGNQFKTFPKVLLQLKNLEKIYISNNEIAELPNEIAQLQQLEILDIKNNHLKTLPSQFGQLQNLHTLYCSENEFKVLPASVGQLKSLKKLDFKGNLIQEIPNEIGGALALENVDLSNNQISSLPPSIGDLVHLKKLHLANNQLSALPNTLLNLANLNSNTQKYEWDRGIKLEGNNFNLTEKDSTKEPLELISEILNQNKPANFSNTQTSFSNFETEEKLNFAQNKAIEEEYNILAFGESEWKVLEILENIFDFSEDKKTLYFKFQDFDIAFNFYNYGFLSVDAAKQEILQAPNSIYIFALNDVSILPSFKKFKNPVLTFTAEHEKVEDSILNVISLKKAIKKTQKIASFFNKSIYKFQNKKELQADVLALDEHLAELNQLYISKQDFLSIAQNFGLSSKAEQIKALTKMHQKGLVHFMQKSYFLQNKILINKQLLYQYLQSIFNSIYLAKQGGIIDYADFQKLLSPKESESTAILLLNLLLENKWCFSIHQQKLLFPYFLSDQEPELEWNTRNEYAVDYNIPAGGEAIVYHMMHDLDPYIAFNLRWKNGLMLHVKDSVVLLKYNSQSRKLELRIKGIDDTPAKNFVKIYMDALFKKMNLTFEMQIKCTCNLCVNSKQAHFHKQADILKRKELNYQTIICPKSLVDVHLNELLD